MHQGGPDFYQHLVGISRLLLLAPLFTGPMVGCIDFTLLSGQPFARVMLSPIPRNAFFALHEQGALYTFATGYQVFDAIAARDPALP